MNSFLNSDDDWIEVFRRYWYPKLHPYLKRFGGYGIGVVTEKQYAGTVNISEEELEPILVNIGFERNPIAAYKTHESDDRKSEGSWRLLPDSDPLDDVEKDKQVHVTLLPSFMNGGRIDIYAHYEYNWEKSPRKHLNAKDYKTEWAVEYMNRVLEKKTYLEVIQK